MSSVEQCEDGTDSVIRCEICMKTQQSPGPLLKKCSRCVAHYHISCFQKQYNGTSAVPGNEFVCTKCALTFDGEKTVDNQTQKKGAKRNRAQSLDRDSEHAKRTRNDESNKTPTDCPKCQKKTTNTDAIECDGCSIILHIGCEVTKRDMDARKKSNRLRLLCTECCSSSNTIMAENIKIIRKYVEKIDLHSQTQQLARTEIESGLKKIDASVQNINDKIANGNNDSGNARKPTFAETVKMNSKPAVIIKPKDLKQHSKTTMDEIKSQINYKDIEACGVSNVNGGGIVINCQTSSSTMKVKQMVEEKFGDK